MPWTTRSLDLHISEIAKKYAGQADAAVKLAERVKEGGSGNWGNSQMPPHFEMPDAKIQEIVQWILSLKDAPAARADPSGGKNTRSTLEDGKTVTLDFPLFVEGMEKDKKVTKGVFRGYELYNSYCFRCHGTDATESELAPSLRHALEVGMTPQQFLAVAMPGREDKGMPSWAGFLERRRDDEHLPVRERPESRTRGSRQATVRKRVKQAFRKTNPLREGPAMNWKKRLLLLVLVLGACGAVGSLLLVAQQPGGTSLDTMSKDANQWVMPLGNYAGTRHSTLNQITTQNAE